MNRDFAIVALVVVNACIIAVLAVWYVRGLKRGAKNASGRWRYLGLYYGLIIAVLVEAGVIGVLVIR